MTQKEALLTAYHGGVPDFVPSGFSGARCVIMPGDRYAGMDLEGEDPWGTRWTKPMPGPNYNGSFPTAGCLAVNDPENWRSQITVPTLDAAAMEEYFRFMCRDVDRENEVVVGLCLAGPFERWHHLVGFEEALMSFYTAPEAVHDFMNAMEEYKLACIDILIDAIDPDIIELHDDWGMNAGMLFSPAIWREFIKPHEKRFAEHIHARGKLYEHHSCGVIASIVGDLVEIGVDAINPVMTCNDIPYLRREYAGAICMRGGIDNQLIESPGISEERIRAEVRRAIDQCAPGGGYIPYYTALDESIVPIVDDECKRYGGGYDRA